jgi:hypothetical protein
MRRIELVPLALLLLGGIMLGAAEPNRWSNILDGRRAAGVDERSDRTSAVICPPGCLTDLDLALERSTRTGRPLLAWVAMSPADRDAARFVDTLATADPVHVCISENGGNSAPRVIMLDPRNPGRGITWKAGELDGAEAVRALAIHDRLSRSVATVATGAGPSYGAVPSYSYGSVPMGSASAPPWVGSPGGYGYGGGQTYPSYGAPGGVVIRSGGMPMPTSGYQSAPIYYGGSGSGYYGAGSGSPCVGGNCPR